MAERPASPHRRVATNLARHANAVKEGGAPAGQPALVPSRSISRRPTRAGTPRRRAMAQDIRQLLEMELQDTYSAETQILDALPQLEEAAQSQSLKRAFREHLEVTQRQVERLEQVCKQLGFDPEG